MRTGDEKSGCIAVSDDITGDLLANELIVRFVFVERADHVVAIHPGVLAIQIAFAAIGLGPADHVEPVLRPTLAEVW